MTAFIRPEFTPGTLPTYLGYHLQIFAAGRAKISLQTENKKKIEFYTALPKRDRDGLRRQKARSLAALPDHFAAVDEILSEHPDAKVFRIHEKGNNNGTADNAHLLASLEADALWLVMSGVVHRWALTAVLVHVLIAGKGEKTGVPSLFNEYMPSYEHDWQDAGFEIADYKVGQRDVRGQPSEAPQLERPSPAKRPMPKPVSPAPKIESKVPVDPMTETEADYVLDDPSEDPVTFTDPPEDQTCDDGGETFPVLAEDTGWKTQKRGKSTLYSTDDLRKLVLGKDGQPGQHPTY